MKEKHRINPKAGVTVRSRYAPLPKRALHGHVEIGVSLAFAVDKGPKKGLDFDLFTQNYMITNKLTLNLPSKLTLKKIPN